MSKKISDFENLDSQNLDSGKLDSERLDSENLNSEKLDSDKIDSKMLNSEKLRGLYAISDEKLTPYDELANFLEYAIQGGVKIFQLRDKTNTDSEIIKHIWQLSDICAKKGVLFVINDRVQLATRLFKELGENIALHIGEDTDFIATRKAFDGILGVSCYNDLNRAVDMQNNGADYVAFGAMFDSKTKPNARRASVEILTQAKQILKIPICAIGGISTSNISLLKNADMCAVIGSLWGQNNEQNFDKFAQTKQNAKDLISNWKQQA